MGDSQQEKGKGNYNQWSVEDSNMLLQLLVEAVKNGWRDANGIISKQTIEAKIVPVLNEKLGCQKTQDHVKNRVKTLRGRYQSICQLFRHISGFGWDPVTKRFTASDEVWEGFLRSHPKSQGIRKETFADYEDLMTVFGDRRQFLAPFRGVRYHLQDFAGNDRDPVNANELFNLQHASLRNVVEKIFGVFKSRFTIFKSAPSFPIKTQAELVLACAELHNFLRNECRSDEFPIESEDDESEDEENDDEPGNQTQEQQRQIANAWRAGIATNMWTYAVNDRIQR